MKLAWKKNPGRSLLKGDSFIQLNKKIHLASIIHLGMTSKYWWQYFQNVKNPDTVVKNYEESEVLPFLQASKLAWYICVSAKTSGSETKDFAFPSSVRVLVCVCARARTNVRVPASHSVVSDS